MPSLFLDESIQHPRINNACIVLRTLQHSPRAVQNKIPYACFNREDIRARMFPHFGIKASLHAVLRARQVINVMVSMGRPAHIVARSYRDGTIFPTSADHLSFDRRPPVCIPRLGVILGLSEATRRPFSGAVFVQYYYMDGHRSVSKVSLRHGCWVVTIRA